MASSLVCYTGRTFNPPILHETGFGTAVAMFKFDAAIRERGMEWWMYAPEEELRALVNAASTRNLSESK